MIPGAEVAIVDGAEVLDTDSVRLLITEAAGWHHVAQLSVKSHDRPSARHAYRMRETLSRYVAARSHFSFHEVRARAIIAARFLD